MGEFSGADLTASHRRLSIKDFPSGAFVIGLSALCGVCEKNGEAWRDLADQARQLGVRVVWMSRDSIEQMKNFVGPREDLGDVVIADPTYWTYLRLKLQFVPQSMVVASDGTVRKAFAGTLTPEHINALLGALQALNDGPSK